MQSIRVNYPWPDSGILRAASKDRAYERHGKGKFTGGQFKGEELQSPYSAENRRTPEMVVFSRNAYLRWNRKRVVLAKLKRQQKESANPAEFDGKIDAMDSYVKSLRSEFDENREAAKAQGHIVDSRGKWKKQEAKPSKNGKVDTTKRDLEVAKANAKLARKNDHEGIETVVVVDKNGKVVLQVDGVSEGVVKFSEKDKLKIWQVEGVTLTHDHPNGGSFSDADIDTALDWNIDKLQAIGRAGTIGGDPKAYYEYTMQFGVNRVEGAKAQNAFREKFIKQQSISMPKFIERTKDAFGDEYTEAANSFLQDMTHDVNKEIADEFGWTYTRELKHVE